MESLLAAYQNIWYNFQHPAYSAMFKSSSTVPTVMLLLQHMYMFIGAAGLEPAPTTLLQPRFACVDIASRKKYEYLDLGYDPWLKCSGSASRHGLNTFYAEGTAYIFVCPLFFYLMPKPTRNICPAVRRNRFIGEQTSLSQEFRIYSLAYDLTRFYLGRNALDSTSIPHEQFDWNDCVFNLNELESVLNPTNLELYVACKPPREDE